MAQFLGSVQGQRGEATRLGSKNSGLVVRANGWQSGVKVVAGTNSDGVDVFDIYATGGSGYGTGQGLIATVSSEGIVHHGRNGSITAEKLANDVFQGESWDEIVESQR